MTQSCSGLPMYTSSTAATTCTTPSTIPGNFSFYLFLFFLIFLSFYLFISSSFCLSILLSCCLSVSLQSLCSAVGGDRDRILVATSTTLESGSWTQKGEIGLPKAFPVYSRIDANLILDPPSAPFIGFGSYAWGLFGIRMASSSGTPLYLSYPLCPSSSFVFFCYFSFLCYFLSAPLKVVGGSPSLMIASKPIPSDPGPTGLNRTEVRGERGKEGRGEGRKLRGNARRERGGEGEYHLIYL